MIVGYVTFMFHCHRNWPCLANHGFATQGSSTANCAAAVYQACHLCDDATAHRTQSSTKGLLVVVVLIFRLLGLYCGFGLLGGLLLLLLVLGLGACGLCQRLLENLQDLFICNLLVGLERLEAWRRWSTDSRKTVLGDGCIC